jgi:hypothetical protein
MGSRQAIARRVGGLVGADLGAGRKTGIQHRNNET